MLGSIGEPMVTNKVEARRRGGERAKASSKRPKCDLYIPGHCVHWIQARLAREEPHKWGELEAFEERLITIRFRAGIARYQNHQAEAVLNVAQLGAKVEVSERYGLLGIPLENGHIRLFCIAEANSPWRPCSVAHEGPVSFEDLANRLNERGGFSVAGPVITSWLEEGTPHEGRGFPSPADYGRPSRPPLRRSVTSDDT
jgi:hypothetical protein